MYNGVVVTHEKNGFVYNERSKKNAKKGKDEEANVRTEVGLPPLLLQKRREEKRREECPARALRKRATQARSNRERTVRITA